MPEIQQGRQDDGYKPLQLVGVVVLALLGFAVFFLSFLLAPLAILVIFYLGFAAADRNQRDSGRAPEPPDEPLVRVGEHVGEPPFSDDVTTFDQPAPALSGSPQGPIRPTGIPTPAPPPRARPDLITVPPASPN